MNPIEKLLAGLGLADFNIVAGSAADEELEGSEELDLILGLGGQDVLRGKGALDILVGGREDDHLTGGGQSDIKLGGAGSDIYAYPELAAALVYPSADAYYDALDVILDPGNAGDKDILDLGDVEAFTFKTLLAGCLDVLRDGEVPTALQIGGGGLIDSIHVMDQFKGDGSGLEYLRIGNGPGDADDLMLKIQQGLEGSFEDDLLVGFDQQQGLEWIRGGDGQDFLFGNQGRDRLLGGDDDDALFGGRNNDRLFDGAGKDFLVGGADEDRFVFRPDVTVAPPPPPQASLTFDIDWLPEGFDIVHDFQIGEDKVVLRDYLAVEEGAAADCAPAPIHFADLAFEDALLEGVAGTLVTIPHAIMILAEADEPARYLEVDDHLFMANVAAAELGQEDFVIPGVIA